MQKKIFCQQLQKSESSHKAFIMCFNKKINKKYLIYCTRTCCDTHINCSYLEVRWKIFQNFSCHIMAYLEPTLSMKALHRRCQLVYRNVKANLVKRLLILNRGTYMYRECLHFFYFANLLLVILINERNMFKIIF